VLCWFVVRTLAIVVAGCCLLGPQIARAELGAVELQARGEELAKAGRYSEAIDAFKAADRKQRRASHACLIALAYTRREAWPQAELWLSTCHERAQPGDPLPEWAPEAKTLIEQRLATANVAPIELVVEPAGTDATLTASSFAPDEQFPPRTIYLPPGHHVVIAHATGYPAVERTIAITDRTPQRIVIELRVETAVPVRAATRSRTPRRLLIAGGVLAGAGAIAHAWMAYERSKLSGATTGDEYDAHSGRYDVARAVSIGGYALGAAALITGIVLRSRARDERTTVTAHPIEGGALAVIEWTR
jgi:hypothetical protein